MGIGIVSISTNQKKEQSGAPFTADSAHNGTSIDVDGKVVLGNDLADPAAPAALISDREIVMQDAVLGAFSLFLNAELFSAVTTRMDGSVVELTSSTGGIPTVTLDSPSGSSVINVNASGGLARMDFRSGTAGAGGQCLLSMRANPDLFQIRTGLSAGVVEFLASNLTVVGIGFMRIETSTVNVQIGKQVGFNGADVQLSGTTTYRYLLQGQGAGTLNINRDLDSGKLFTNSGAANFQLPNMAAANARVGFILRVTCTNAAGVTITAEAGQQIRFGSLSTSLGGTISSTDVGAYVVIVLVNPALWVTETFNGAWVLT